MKTLHPQYIVDANHHKTSVVLLIEEWNEILSAMEELDDIRAYDHAKSTTDEVIPFEQAINEIENNER